MATIISASIDVTKIPKEKLIKGEKGTYLNVSVIVNDESRYGQNVGITVGQTKDERDAKQPKTYIGNGKVIWTDGTITLAKSDDDGYDQASQDAYAEPASDGVPF